MLEALQTCSKDICSKEERTEKLRKAIRFILSHFEGRQQLFPRKISTAQSQCRQFTVYNEKQILNECIKANFIDCRLNAYPVLPSDGLVDLVQAPVIIFLDIDMLNGLSYEEALGQLNKALKQALTITNKKLNGCIPTVLWTGNGYHIYVVLNTRPLELITDLAELSNEPSKEFLKFAEIILTNRKADTRHNHSFNSYLLRIPYTFNSKCIAQGKDAEVKVFQRFDTSAIPTIDSNLLREFRLYLADLDVKNKEKTAKRGEYKKTNNRNCEATKHKILQTCLWIETLLQMPISDHRKHTLELVLAPYLVVIKRQSRDETYAIVKKWALKCNALRALEPSFDYRIKVAIDKSIQNGIPPIRRETIANNYPTWYNDFMKWHLFN